MEEAIEQIENYLQGTMDAAQKASFELRLLQEPELKAELALHQKIHGFVKATEANKLKEQVKMALQAERTQAGTEQTSTLSQKKSLTIGNWLPKIAAVLLLTVGLGWWIFKDSGNNFNQQAAFVQLLEQNPAVLQGTEDLHNQWVAAFQAKDYSKVIQLVKDQPNTDTEALYYLGLSHAATNNYTQAVKILNTTALKNSLFAEKAEWLKALVLLKNKQTKEATDTLTQIANSSSYFAKQAKEALENVEKNN
jgi:hypothetical protein